MSANGNRPKRLDVQEPGKDSFHAKQRTTNAGGSTGFHGSHAFSRALDGFPSPVLARLLGMIFCVILVCRRATGQSSSRATTAVYWNQVVRELVQFDELSKIGCPTGLRHQCMLANTTWSLGKGLSAPVGG
jgi:hypothetical protein